MADQDEQTRPTHDEIATTRDGRDITRGFVDALPLLPPMDSVLQLRGGGDYRIYEEVLRDDQVAATLQQRRQSVTSREWEVIAGGEDARDEAAAEFLRDQLKAIHWDRVTGKMHHGVFFGFAVGEPIWAARDGQVVMDAIKVRKQRRFGFGPDMQLKLRTARQPLGEDLPPRKFWVLSIGSDHDDEPYGLGLAHWLYWPVYFKRGGMRAWLQFLDKYGSPTSVGKFPSGATRDEKRLLLDAVEAVHSDSGIIIPEKMVLEFLETARQGTADHSGLYDRMDRAIAKVVLGQVASTEGTPGRLGNDDTQADVRADLVKADADVLCESFNQTIVRWLTEWNFPGANPPAVWRKMEAEEDLNQQAERDKALTDIGYRPTLERVTETYGDGYERVPEPEPPAGGGGPLGFAEPDDVRRTQAQDQAVISELAETLAERWEELLGRRLEDILALAEDSGDLETLRERLARLATAEPPPELVQLFERAGVNAQLWGRWRAERNRRRLDED